MEAYFGIDAGQAARSGYRTYKAGAGVKTIDLSVSATYLINDHWICGANRSWVSSSATPPTTPSSRKPSSPQVC
ncbi:MipA/OmpV family protein (plasmid) [Rhizobium sp. RCAM05350]|nr:MipA/OmpV family protein [Rhizobium sp. RCAM05350]